ncbi:hypothetical protein K0038_00898 [Pseudomonas syringae]|nr:hypothetical protein [Pseudomonas syringae]
MLRVGMHFVALRVTHLRRIACSKSRAARPEMHPHAARGDDSDERQASNTDQR